MSNIHNDNMSFKIDLMSLHEAQVQLLSWSDIWSGQLSGTNAIANGRPLRNKVTLKVLTEGELPVSGIYPESF